MKPSPRHVAFLGLAALVVVACSVRAGPPKGSVHLEKALSATHTISVLEGLPHPGAERDVFEAERGKPHRVVDGQHVYETPLSPPAAELETVTGWLRSPGAISRWEGEKKCGGFHSDVVFAATDGTSTWHVHLCFGCSELLVTGPRLKQPARFELSSSGKGYRMRELIKGWRTSRPKPAHE